MFRKFKISNRLPNKYFPKIVVGCPCKYKNRGEKKSRLLEKKSSISVKRESTNYHFVGKLKRCLIFRVVGHCIKSSHTSWGFWFTKHPPTRVSFLLLLFCLILCVCVCPWLSKTLLFSSRVSLLWQSTANVFELFPPACHIMSCPVA